MRILVTGAGGFVGSRLVPELAALGHDIIPTFHTKNTGGPVVDMTDQAAVELLVAAARPERAYHLAAQSSAGVSWREPGLTYQVNVTGTHYLLEAMQRHVPECRVLVAATSDEYGMVDPTRCPLDESAPLRPVSPYAVSKVAQEWVGRTFFEGFGLPVLITRAFMHIGPGQPASFATADWARQIALAEIGLHDPVVKVGNLDLAREFGDVRDVVRAYIDVVDKGEPGEAYNVATGEPKTLRETLEVLVSLAQIDIDIQVDPAKIRPADPPLLTGSALKLERLTGWKPQRGTEETLAEVLDYWRAEVGSHDDADRPSPPVDARVRPKPPRADAVRSSG